MYLAGGKKLVDLTAYNMDTATAKIVNVAN